MDEASLFKERLRKRRKTCFSKEPSSFRIRGVKKPRQDKRLSGVVAVFDRGLHGYANINFSDRAIQRIGEKMPQGLSPDNPAFLYVVRRVEDDEYYVFSLYVENDDGVLLWCQDDKPTWLESGLLI